MRTIYTPSLLKKDEEEKLWNNALIVFDTCALLDFYYLQEEYQTIISEILELLKDRIWIPAQVKHEFEKNHLSVCTKPITEKYSDKKVVNNKLIDDLKQNIAQWDKKYYHPFISDDSLNQIKEILVKIEPDICKIKTIITKEYEKRKQEIRDLCSKDIIYQTVKQLTIGDSFSFSELKKIVFEGQSRYINKIPPGYKDSEDKDGIRQYGDLIIWKEIIKKAKDSNKDILFITNDQKADWVIVDETKNDKNAEKPNQNEIGNPRRELLCEFEEETGHNIWIYSTPTFIEKLEDIFQPKQHQLEFNGKLGIVRDVLRQQEQERYIKDHSTGDNLFIKCDQCGHLFEIDAGEFGFDWECGKVAERGMGEENEYTSHESCKCPECNQQIDVEFHVWEYPLGSINYQEIEADNGTIENEINLSTYIDLFDEYETCCRCGQPAILNSIGLCDDCQKEFDRFVNSDD